MASSSSTTWSRNTSATDRATLIAGSGRPRVSRPTELRALMTRASSLPARSESTHHWRLRSTPAVAPIHLVGLRQSLVRSVTKLSNMSPAPASSVWTFGIRCCRASVCAPTLLRALADDDVLLVTRLDRLARSTRDLLNVLDAVAKQQAGFRSLKDPWADTTTPHGRLMLTVLGGLAEFERELIRARTGEGASAPRREA